jgi:small-conductance mechanosensitive channel
MFKCARLEWRKHFIGVASCALLVILRPLPAQDFPALNRDAILGHLNVVITWYRNTGSHVEAAGLPSDAIYEDSTRNLAAEVVRMAFQSARAQAAIISANEKSSNTSQGTNVPPSQQNFTQIAARIAAEIDDTQSKLDDVNKQLGASSRSKRSALLSERDKLQGKLSLDKAVQDAVQKMATFAEGATDTVSEGLEGSINQLARSVPEVFASKTPPQPANKAATPPSALANSSGLIGQAVTLVGRMRSMHQIDQMIKETDRVRQNAESLRKPLRDALTAILQRGRNLANTQEPGQTEQQADVRRQYQTMLARFNQLSGAAMPLSQEVLLLEQSRANYIEWRRTIVRESTDTLRSLLIRVIGIALALGVVLILSDVWRRLTFRYIHDPRRRRQFLLLRRFVMGFLVGIVLLVGFVSEFSSLATFAGFVTAGIAVGLQALLLSVAAYFFVVGRYGIRVGDRISIAGVTGDVIEIGLVRLYLMELAGTSVDLFPTGRVVVFSNSVLFQAGTPLFKQIPGTEYAWHELAVMLAPSGNYKLVQDKVFGVVNALYEQYRGGIEQQLGDIEREFEIQLKAPKTEAKLQLADAGVEFIVRYPVDIRSASEIDDHVTRAVVDLINSSPDLKSAIAGPPKIRAAIKG